MLKIRVCIALLINDGVLFRTKKFVPDYRYTTNFVGQSAVDEVFLIDITRAGPSEHSRQTMKSLAERIFCPVTMGGHIRSVGDAAEFFKIGADKVLIGLDARESDRLLGRLADKYGSQAVTFGCDTLRDHCFSPREGKSLFFYPESICEMVAEEGAGEIFLQSHERDGSLTGYDVETLKKVTAAVKIPVVVGTSCGNAQHMIDAVKIGGASGVVTGNIHHFTDGAIRGFKQKLAEAGIAVRPSLETTS